MATGGLYGRQLQGPWDYSRCVQAGPDTHVKLNKKKNTPLKIKHFFNLF